MSADPAHGAAHGAGDLGCEAVLAPHPVCVRSGHGHHERVCSAVAAFDIAEGVTRVASAEAIRTARHERAYGRALATAAEVRRACAWKDRYLPVLRSALANLDPALAPFLP